MGSKPLFLSVATPQQIEYALQNYRKSDGRKAASVSCLISGDPGESVPITLFDGKSFGYVLDETKVDCPHAEFYARNTGGYIPEDKPKQGYVTMEGANPDFGVEGTEVTHTTKFPNKPVSKKNLGFHTFGFVTNAAKWHSPTKTLKEPSLETFAENVGYKYYATPKPEKRTGSAKRYGGQGVMGYNEALVFQKEGAGNPVKGVFISLNSDGTIREPDRRNALEVLQKHPHLKLYLYDREKAKDGHIVKVFSHDEAMIIVGTQLEAGRKWDWSRMRNLVDEGQIAQDATVPAQTIGDRMSQFVKQAQCQEFFAAFEQLDLQKQKDLFEFVWGSKRQIDSISKLSSYYDNLKGDFVQGGSSNEVKQIFNDEMRNKMLQVMAQQEGRQKFVAGYRKALGDYDGTFFDDTQQYDVVKAEMLEFIFRDKMPRRVLISDYVASIPDNALSLIEALQYAWNVGGVDDFEFENLKQKCIATAEDRIGFNNNVRGGLVSRIEQIIPGIKQRYDELMSPLNSEAKSYEQIAGDVGQLLADIVKGLKVSIPAVDAGFKAPSALGGEGAPSNRDYEFMITAETLVKVEEYKESLESAGDPKIGVYLAFNILKSKGMLPAGIDKDYFRYTGSTDERSEALGIELRRQAQDLVSSMSTEKFLELLIQTKKPKFFAESAIRADASLDWNDEEISILGDVNCAVDVTIYDNGRHKLEKASDVHNDPFAGSLLFSPGALLEGGGGKVDIAEVVEGDHVSQEKLSALYERRLLPLLLHANQDVEKNGSKAFVTIPGMGCGCFAGKYGKEIKPKFKAAIMALIEKHQGKLTNIAGVYLDLYDSVSQNEQKTLGETKFISRALMTADGSGRPQLCHPSQYGDEFKDCKLYSVVAWDHVSWPGNDYYPGSRSTDDGVKAAATDSMTKFTRMRGQYVSNPNSVGITKGYESVNGSKWLHCIKERQVDLKVSDNVAVLYGGNLKRLKGNDIVDRYVGVKPAAADPSLLGEELIEDDDFFIEPPAGEESGQKLQKIRERFSRVGYCRDEEDGSNNYFVRFSLRPEAEKFSEKLSQSYGIVGRDGRKVVVPTKLNGEPVYDGARDYNYDSDQVKEYAVILTDENFAKFEAKEKEISGKSDELSAAVKSFAAGAKVLDKFFFGPEENYYVGFDEVKRAFSFAQQIFESGIVGASGGQKSVIIDFFDGDRRVEGYLGADGKLDVPETEIDYRIDLAAGVVHRKDFELPIKIINSYLIFNESNRELLQAEVEKVKLDEKRFNITTNVALTTSAYNVAKIKAAIEGYKKADSAKYRSNDHLLYLVAALASASEGDFQFCTRELQKFIEAGSKAENQNLFQDNKDTVVLTTPISLIVRSDTLSDEQKVELIGLFHQAGCEVDFLNRFKEGLKDGFGAAVPAYGRPGYNPNGRVGCGITPLYDAIRSVCFADRDDQDGKYKVCAKLVACGADPRKETEKKDPQGNKLKPIDSYNSRKSSLGEGVRNKMEGLFAEAEVKMDIARIAGFQHLDEAEQQQKQQNIVDKFVAKSAFIPAEEGLKGLSRDEIGELNIDNTAASVRSGQIKFYKNTEGKIYVAKPVGVESEFGTTLFRYLSKGFYASKHEKLFIDDDGKTWSVSKYDQDIGKTTDLMSKNQRSRLNFDITDDSAQNFMIGYARMMGVLHVFGEADSNPGNFFVNENGKPVKIDNSFFVNLLPEPFLAARDEGERNRIVGCAQANYFFRHYIFGEEGVAADGFAVEFEEKGKSAAEGLDRFSPAFLPQWRKNFANSFGEIFKRSMTDDFVEAHKSELDDPKKKAMYDAFMGGVKDAVDLARDRNFMDQFCGRYGADTEDRETADICRGFFVENATEVEQSLGKSLAQFRGEISSVQSPVPPVELFDEARPEVRQGQREALLRDRQAEAIAQRAEKVRQERELQAEIARQAKAQAERERQAKAAAEKAQRDAEEKAQREEIARQAKAAAEKAQQEALLRERQVEKAQRDAEEKAQRQEKARQERELQLKAQRDAEERAQLAKERLERAAEFAKDQYGRVSSPKPGYESSPSETSSEFSSSESDFLSTDFSRHIVGQIGTTDLSLQDSDEKRVTNQLFEKNVQAQPDLLEQYEKLAPKDGSQNLYSRLLADVAQNPDQALQRINLRNLAATLSAAARYFDTGEGKAGRMALANRSSIKFICDKLFGADLDKEGLKDGQMQNDIKTSLSEKLKIEPGKLQGYLFEKAKEIREREMPATVVAKIDISKLLNQNFDRSV